MIKFTEERLTELFSGFNRKHIMVIGDVMLDQYIWGGISRISPEAPVPVIEVAGDDSFRIGGAANVAYNVKSLGASVLPVGIVGDDSSGEMLKKLFEEMGFPIHGVITDNERPTTVKTRVIAHNQHVVRIDREIKKRISDKIEEEILELIKSHLHVFDGIIIEDYNKGFLVPRLIESVIEFALSKDKLIFVDPKFDHFFNYRKVTLFKPNLKEVTDKLGFRIDSEAALQKAGCELLKRLSCKALMITLGEAGMIIFEHGKEGIRFPTRAVKVHDVSGAGDTAIAVMAVAMTAGASLYEAAMIANHAAGIVCGEVGIIPVDSKRLFQNLKEEH